MNQKYLKKIRVVLSLVFFLFTLFLFVDFAAFFSLRMIHAILYLQFIPSLLEFLHLAALGSAGFIAVILFTLLFGRVYCSSVCPLGTIQDGFGRISAPFRNKKKNRYKKPQTILRYSILGILAAGLLFRNIFVVTLLDPYSLAGKIFSTIMRPGYYAGNNLLKNILKTFDNYSLYPVSIKATAWPALGFSVVFLIIIIYLSSRKGRWYCNAICPVGSLLGLISKISLFKIAIDKTACTSCGFCMNACKSNCINIKKKEIDFSRCVACYNCIGACPEQGIGYRNQIELQKSLINIRVFKSMARDRSRPVRTEQSGSIPRRRFFQATLAGSAGLAGLLSSTAAFAKKKSAKGISDYPVTPPGSVSLWHFTENCTACHLCVSVCPTHVLQPTLFEYGLTGMFQPKMDYWTAFCNHECVKCSQVCPSGAILPISVKQKETLQVGYVWFSRNRCIVKTKHTSCGACSEHCPTKAVTMVPFIDNLMIPVVDEKICIGCGACEFACPTKPIKAIFVESNPYHRVAKKPPKKMKEEEKKDEKKKPVEDFPF
jgi:ferredoxin